jgi:dipeptidase
MTVYGFRLGFGSECKGLNSRVQESMLMCDTLVVLGNASADGVTLFAKNSDRNPNEAHEVVRVPAAHHAPGETVRCTYVEVPQVEQTYEVLLCKPFWIWGAEMGANEHGVAIGNEAVFTKVPYEKGPGLIGMDFLRLALERGRTAREALDVITGLLATYGQSGNCGYPGKLFYHNSFLIADPTDAWVLETAGRQWAAEQVRDVRSISNRISIGQQWDLASPDLVNYAVERHWCRGREDFHFGRCYSDFVHTRLSDSYPRQCRTTDLCIGKKGRLTVEDLMGALRDHGAAAGPDWTPARGLVGATVCAHASFGPVRDWQTTGSMVSQLAPGVQTHFVTGTAAPCTSLFKPVWLGGELPNTGPLPTGTYDEASLYWRHEALHRATLRNYAAALPLYARERDGLEHEFVAGALACRDQSPEERSAYSTQCQARADEVEARWRKRVAAANLPDRRPYLYARAWRTFEGNAAQRTETD